MSHLEKLTSSKETRAFNRRREALARTFAYWGLSRSQLAAKGVEESQMPVLFGGSGFAAKAPTMSTFPGSPN